jgi:hypothetical protein
MERILAGALDGAERDIRVKDRSGPVKMHSSEILAMGVAAYGRNMARTGLVAP